MRTALTPTPAGPVPAVHAVLARGPAIQPPPLTGEFGADWALVSGILRSEYDAVDALPPRPERTEAERRAADTVHEAARETRRRFMTLHAERVYEELTDGLAASPRLADLAGAAAERYAGLVPDRNRMAAENGRLQKHKEGWEVDQGIFFWGLFSAPRAGSHLLRSMLRPTRRALDALPAFRATGRADLGVATLTRRDGVGHLELCNDRYLNAEDDAAVEALETGTDLVLLDPATRVGVLRGAPMTHHRYAGRRVFSAGINLTHVYHGQISLLGFLLRREAGYIAKLVRGLCLEEEPASYAPGPYDLPGCPSDSGPSGRGPSGCGLSGDTWWPEADKPWVGAVDTFAIGGGMQICLALDRVVAADDAYFTLPALEEGLVPGVANFRLPGLTGSRLARRIIFWGHRVEASGPEGPLVCDEVVPADAMDAAVDRAAQHLDNPAVIANRRMLAMVEEPLDLFRRYMAAYALEQARRLHSADLIANLERTWISRSGGRART